VPIFSGKATACSAVSSLNGPGAWCIEMSILPPKPANRANRVLAITPEQMNAYKRTAQIEHDESNATDEAKD
jgi:hypothetical protein